MSMSWMPLQKAAEGGSRSTKRKSVWSWLILLFTLLTLVSWLFPFWLSVTTAFKDSAELASSSATSLPHTFYWGNFTRFWSESDFPRKLFNSILISSVACMITVVFSFLNAVALGVGRIKRTRLVLTVCLIAFAIPQEAVVYPTYKVSKILHIYGNPIAVILILGILYSAFGTFLLGEVMKSFPRELIDAAFVDGVRIREMLRHVIYPLLKPTLQTLAVMVFIWNWNEYMMPLILLPDNATQTVPIALASTYSQPGFNVVPDIGWGAAGALISAAPTILFFLLFQRVIARGITMGTE